MAAAQAAVAAERAAQPPDGWRWETPAGAAMAAASLEAAAAARLERALPGWAAMGWGERPAAEMALLPQAAEMRRLQLADDEQGPILRWLETGRIAAGTPPTEARRVRHQARDYRVAGGLLYHTPRVTVFADAEPLQLVIPFVARDKLLRETHAGVLGAHVGFAKLYGLLQRRYFWVGMWTDAARMVASCAACRQAKARRRHHPRHGLAAMQTYPFQRVHIDLWDAGMASADGYRHVLTVVDTHTHWCELIPLRSKAADEVARAFFRAVICRHGVPSVVTSDQGGEFTAAIFGQLLRLYGVRHILTAPYRPQSNGVAERIHGFIRPALAILAEQDHAAWDRRVEAVAFAYRSSPVRGTSFTPFMLMHGREPRLPGQLVGEPPARVAVAPATLVEELQERLERAFALVRLERQRVLEQRLQRTEQRPAAPEFAVGDMVHALRPTRVGTDRSAKLTFSWRGPFVVEAARHPLYDLVAAEGTGPRAPREAHADDLTPALARPVLPSDCRPRYPGRVGLPLAGSTPVAKGDLMLVTLPDDDEPWRLVRAEEDPTPQGTCKVHVYQQTRPGLSVLAARWQPGYFRPDTGEDVTHDVPAPRLEAYHMLIPLSAVVVGKVQLTATGRLRRVHIQQLSDAPLTTWALTRRQGHQVADLPAPGARVARMFGDVLHAGTVTRLVQPEADEAEAPVYYHVVYADGDAADYTEEELRPLLRAHALSDFRHRAPVAVSAGEAVQAP
jgi:transposase InsO family protein